MDYDYHYSTIQLSGDDGDIDVDVKIYYEYDSDYKQNNNLWTVIDSDFTFQGTKYRKGMEFPSKLEKYVDTKKSKKFEDYVFELIN